MQLSTANAAIPLATAINALTGLLARIDQAIAAGADAHLDVCRVRLPDGTQIDLLPGGEASPELTGLALTSARTAYQTQLDALTAQLEAL